MKKLHKTGTTILLALAPAAALGVVGGVIATSIKTDQGLDGKITKDQWLEEYEKRQVTMAGNYYCFDIADVKHKLNGTEHTIAEVCSYIDEPEANTQKYKSVWLEMTDAGMSIITMNTAEIKQEINRSQYPDKIKYYADSSISSLKIVFPDTEDVDNNYQAYTFNKFGYLLQYTQVENGVATSLEEIEYLKDPYLTKNHTMSFFKQEGEPGLYQGTMSLYGNETYTFTFTIDGQNSANSIELLKSNSEKVDMKNVMIIVNDQEKTDWTVDQDKSIKLTTPITSGTVKVQFNVDSDMDEAYLYAKC